MTGITPNNSLLDDPGYKHEIVKAYLKSALNFNELKKFSDSLNGTDPLLLPDSKDPRNIPVAGRFSYLPWIGRNYPGNLENRVFFIAESFFKSNSSNWNYHDCGCIILSEFILNVYIPRPYPKFFEAINPIECSNPEQKDIKDFVYSNAVFMNICQRCMRSSSFRPDKKKTKTAENDYINGWQTWFNAARILRPTLCVCNGVESASFLEAAALMDGKVKVDDFSRSNLAVDVSKNNEEEDRVGDRGKMCPPRAIVTIENNPIEILWVLHSTHNGKYGITFKPQEWRKYLEEQNLFKKWVKELRPIYAKQTNQPQFGGLG